TPPPPAPSLFPYTTLFRSGPAPSTASACPDPSANNVAAVVKDYAGYSFHDLSAMQVAVSYPDSTNAASNRIRVVVNYDYVPYLRSEEHTSELQSPDHLVCR